MALGWGFGKVGAWQEVPIWVALGQLWWRLITPDLKHHQNIKNWQMRIEDFCSEAKASPCVINSPVPVSTRPLSPRPFTDLHWQVITKIFSINAHIFNFLILNHYIQYLVVFFYVCFNKKCFEWKHVSCFLIPTTLLPLSVKWQLIMHNFCVWDRTQSFYFSELLYRCGLIQNTITQSETQMGSGWVNQEAWRTYH